MSATTAGAGGGGWGPGGRPAQGRTGGGRCLNLGEGERVDGSNGGTLVVSHLWSLYWSTVGSAGPGWSHCVWSTSLSPCCRTGSGPAGWRVRLEVQSRLWLQGVGTSRLGLQGFRILVQGKAK